MAALGIAGLAALWSVALVFLVAARSGPVLVTVAAVLATGLLAVGVGGLVPRERRREIARAVRAGAPLPVDDGAEVRAVLDRFLEGEALGWYAVLGAVALAVLTLPGVTVLSWSWWGVAVGPSSGSPSRSSLDGCWGAALPQRHEVTLRRYRPAHRWP